MTRETTPIASRPSPPRHVRAAAGVLLAATSAFVVLMAVAMMRYPGGTWFEPQRVGHDFWRNFLSDLLHGETLRGEANPGAPWAQAGLVALLPALAALWWLAAATLRAARPRLARAIAILGAISTLGLIAVPLTPTDRFPTLHGLAALAAGGPGVAAAILAVLGQRRAGAPTALVAAATLGLSFALLNLTLYIHHQYLGGTLTTLVPASQKAAALGILTWMTGTAILALRRGARSGLERG